MKLVVAADAEEVATRACRLLLRAEREAIRERGCFRIALAGGSTPRRLYAMLAESKDAHFDRWQVFFGDERFVPADHPDSNFRMARETLLDRVAIPPRQVHAVPTDAGSPQKAAELYALALRRAFGAGFPRLDLVLLGMGGDGHTASLFPESEALEAGPGAICLANYAPSQRSWRVTLSFAVLNAARRVVFVVSGADKAPALAKVLAPSPEQPPLPAARVHPAGGELAWIVDAAAAARLPR